jgi:hypothetical protein
MAIVRHRTPLEFALQTLGERKTMTKTIRNISLISAALLVGVAIGGTAPLWTKAMSAYAADGAAPAPAKKKLVPQKILFIMWKKDGAHKETPDEMKVMLGYQAKMERDGQKFIGGALNSEDGKRSGGIVIIRANSWAEARAICDADPGVKDGSTTYELHQLSLNSGTFSVQLNFSDAGETNFMPATATGPAEQTAAK